ncbi:MAG TPA: ankyrin repeat domain-containing protein [Candidatus Limnocylindrales bacterium]|nr:ankyrin repeat domain-containing protein [Candidatus Limnocylindrales bacterium]
MTQTEELFGAIRAGDLAAVDRLLAERPYLAGASDAAGLSAVTVAAYHRQPAIIERLLAAQPDLDRFEAAIVGDLGRLAELLDEPDAEPIDQRSGDGFTALHLAAYFGRLRAAQELLDRGADPNAWSSGGLRVQPLHSAVSAGHEALARLLVERGARPDQAQDGGYTPLHAAAANGLTGLSDFLIAHGANPKALTQDILTPADLAERAGHGDLAAHLRSVGG